MENTENIKLEFLRRIDLFSSMTDEELQGISGDIVIEEFKKNEVILREEDTGGFMYIILFGKVKAYKTTEEGKEIILALHQTNEFFGELSLIDGKTTPATVSAIEDSLISIISKKAFYSFLAQRPPVLEKILHILCARIRESWEKIRMLNAKHASQKIILLLLMLSHEYGKKTPEGILMELKLTHQDIADMTGLTRESVTRSMDKLQKENEISVLNNKLIRLNTGFLRQYADAGSD
ncbi:MAG: Crp/Fnr family transcriptional regulator [Nitrospirota bacterium]